MYGKFSKSGSRVVEPDRSVPKRFVRRGLGSALPPTAAELKKSAILGNLIMLSPLLMLTAFILNHVGALDFIEPQYRRLIPIFSAVIAFGLTHFMGFIVESLSSRDSHAVVIGIGSFWGIVVLYFLLF